MQDISLRGGGSGAHILNFYREAMLRISKLTGAMPTFEKLIRAMPPSMEGKKSLRRLRRRKIALYILKFGLYYIYKRQILLDGKKSASNLEKLETYLLGISYHNASFLKKINTSKNYKVHFLLVF